MKSFLGDRKQTHPARFEQPIPDRPALSRRRTGGSGRQRKLHKAFLRWHDADNWPLLREVLKAMGCADQIGPGKRHLIPAWQPAGTGPQKSAPATRRSAPTTPAKPLGGPPARRHPDVPRHPLSRRKGG